MKGTKHTRVATFERASVDLEARTVPLAFSSEEPYERSFGMEVLDHAPQSVRLGRLAGGGALLLDHDPTRLIGVIERASIDEDKIGRAVVRFGRSELAEEAFRDVQDGIRRHVSVGYMIHDAQPVRGSREIRVTDWEPYELSLVAIPADPTVGVGRAADEQQPQLPEPPKVAPEPKSERKLTMSDNIQQPAGADLEAARVRSILDLGDQYSKYLGARDAADAVRNGKSVEQFRDLIMSKMETRHTDTSAAHVGMTKTEARRYSLGRALRAAVLGDWSDAGLEREASEAVAKIMGRAPEGFYIPLDIYRRDFNVGTSTEAGNLVATDLRGDLYVDALRNAMVMAGLGVRILPGLTANIDIPRKSVASTLGMLTEIGSAAETNPNIAKLTLSPKRIGAYVEVSKQAIIQSSMALEPMIRDDLLMGAAILLENQAINGNGTAPNILGLRNTTAISTVAAGANGATVAWPHFVDLESAVANANAEPDRLAGYLTNTKVRGRAKQVQRGTNLPFIWDNGAQPVNGYRVAVTNNVPSNLTKGTSTTVCSATFFSSDWSMGVLGLFGAPDIVVDPYTKSDTGQVKITLNQFADFGVRQPGAFAVMLDQLT
jgi:HK97 family phage major capsid protein